MAEIAVVYATIAQVRASGVTTASAPDFDDSSGHMSVTEALSIASRMVDDFTGNAKYGFAQSAPGVTENIDDVRGYIVHLPAYANAITAVTINAILGGAGRTLDQTSGYVVETQSPFGIRALRVPGFGYKDVDGFPPSGASSWAYRVRSGSSTFNRVSVTATWGFPYVPTPVRRATILLAKAEIAQNPGAEALVIRDIGTQADHADASYMAPAAAWEAQAYALLAPYENVSQMVG